MEQTDSRKDRLFLLGMILSMTCWGFSWSSGKILATYANPVSISFFRFAITFISLVVILPILKTPLRISRSGLVDLVLAAVMISTYTFLFFRGLVTGMPGAGGVLVTTLNPIIANIIVLIINRRMPSRNQTIGLLLGGVAGLLMLRLFDHASQILEAGNLFFLFAAFSWAILSIFTSRASRYGNPLAFSFWMYGISSMIMFLFTDHAEIGKLFVHADSVFWWNLFFSGTITTSIATTFYFFATSKIGAGRASAFIFLVPFSAAIGSWIFFSEIPQWHTVAGGLLGIIAVYMLNLKTSSREITKSR